MRARASDRSQDFTIALPLVILLCSLFVVLLAANGPSFLSATTRAHFFPQWIAGPLARSLPWFTPSNRTLESIFTGVVIVSFASYLLGVARVSKLSARSIILTILAVQLVFVLSPPLTLTDVFNYINYARMEVVHNLDPYATIPALEPHRDPAFALSNWHNLLSPYGPLFTILMFAIVPFGVAASFWLAKISLAICSLACLWFISRCAQLLQVDPKRALFYAGLNPLVLLWGLGGDHNDLAMMFFILLALHLLLRGTPPSVRSSIGAGQPQPVEPGPFTREATFKDPVSKDAALKDPALKDPALKDPALKDPAPNDAALQDPRLKDARLGRLRQIPFTVLLRPLWLELAAGAALAAAVFVKASAGIIIPVIIAGLLRTPRRAVQTILGGLLATVSLGLVSYLVFGAHLPGIGTQGSIVTDFSLPNLLGLALGQGGETHTLRTLLLAALVLAVLGCCIAAFRSGDFISWSGWATIALLVTLAWVLPWYIVWVLPLAALSRSRRLHIATVAMCVYLIVVWVPSSSQLWKAIGFEPQQTVVGQVNHRYVNELLH